MRNTLVAILMVGIGISYLSAVPLPEDRSPAVPPPEDRIWDWAPLLDQLESTDAETRFEAARAMRNDRGKMLATIENLARKHMASGEIEDGRIAGSFIALLSLNRAKEAVPFLAEHLAYQVPEPDYGYLMPNIKRPLPSPATTDPCAAALIQIGTPAIEPVLQKLMSSDDESVAACAAFVLKEVLGSAVGRSYLKKRIEGGKSAVRGQSLARGLKKLQELDQDRDFLWYEAERLDLPTRSSLQLNWQDVVTGIPRSQKIKRRAITEFRDLEIPRRALVTRLAAWVEESITDDARRASAETAIQVLGDLRGEAAVPLLAKHLAFEGSRAPTGDRQFPCVEALVEIGSQNLEPILKRVGECDDKTVQMCAARVLRRTLGKDLATIYVQVRADTTKDRTERQRLEALRQAIEKE